MPKLETLYFDITENLNPFGPTPSFDPYPYVYEEPLGDPPLGFIMGLSDGFRDAHKLHEMYFIRDPILTGQISIFDQLDDLGELTAIINSYKHGDDKELIHARFRAPSVEEERREDTRAYIADGPNSPLRRVTDDEWEDAMRGEELEELDEYPEPVWIDWTSWGRWIVPLEAIDDMRLAQGATDEEWTGGGIDVDDRAWAILTEWKEEMEREQAELDEFWRVRGNEESG